MTSTDKDAIVRQYQSSDNLNARIALHQRFSINPGFIPWLFDQLELPAASPHPASGLRHGQFLAGEPRAYRRDGAWCLSDASAAWWRRHRKPSAIFRRWKRSPVWTYSSSLSKRPLSMPLSPIICSIMCRCWRRHWRKSAACSHRKARCMPRQSGGTTCVNSLPCWLLLPR